MKQRLAVAPVLMDYQRTVFGRRGGVLAQSRPDDLAARPIVGLLERNAWLEPTTVSEVILGNTNGAGEENRNVARMAALLAGMDVRVPGVTVNRLCGSGGESVALGSRMIRSGDGEVVIAGGVESMSRAPFVVEPVDTAFPRSLELHQTAVGWRMVNEQFPDDWVAPLGRVAELSAEDREISRSAQDDWAVRSHELAASTLAVSVRGPSLLAGDGPLDEGVRGDVSLDRVSALRPSFSEHGSVTAGNASPLSDGAAALLMASPQIAARVAGGEPLAKLLHSVVVGVEPHRFSDAPAAAVRKLLQDTALSPSEIALWEIQEAFASVVLCTLDELPEIPGEDVNVLGGAIAVGHPLGASFTRVIGDLCLALRQRGGGFGIACVCIGVGMGQAVLVSV